MYLDAHYAKVRRGGRVQDVAILANDIYLRGYRDKDKEVVSSVPVRCRRLGGVIFSFIAAMSGSGISIMTWGLQTVISASMQMKTSDKLRV